MQNSLFFFLKFEKIIMQLRWVSPPQNSDANNIDNNTAMLKMISPSNRSLRLLRLLLISCASVFVVVAAELFRVGQDQGWREPDPKHTDLYNLWAAALPFHVGDSIYFKYTNDSVWVVNKTGYYHCNATDPTEAFDDGNTVYVLKAPGLLYFVSGNVEHCKNGQRMIIDVMALHPPEQPPSAKPVGHPPSPPSPSAAELVAPPASPRPSAGWSTSAPAVGVVVVVAVVALLHISLLHWFA